MLRQELLDIFLGLFIVLGIVLSGVWSLRAIAAKRATAFFIILFCLLALSVLFALLFPPIPLQWDRSLLYIAVYGFMLLFMAAEAKELNRKLDQK